MENRFKSIDNGNGNRKLLSFGTNTKDDIFQDTVTGVLYLQSTNTRGTAIVPLIDVDGKPLTQTIYPNWKAGVDYEQGNIVLYDDSHFEVVKAHTSEDHWRPTAKDWLYKPIES